MYTRSHTVKEVYRKLFLDRQVLSLEVTPNNSTIILGLDDGSVREG